MPDRICSAATDIRVVTQIVIRVEEGTFFQQMIIAGFALFLLVPGLFLLQKKIERVEIPGNRIRIPL